jgi:mono/diheme cytochrome c family protein
MPFPWYTRLSRADVDAIKAYLDTQPPVRQENRRNALLWPVSWRIAASAWKTLFFHPGAYRPDPQKSAAWNRGAYLIEGAGHCAACHTDKNLFGATEINRDLLGGDAGDSWFAPGLSRDLRDGIGGWSAQETVAYLKTGANSRAAAAGPMVDVVMDSTQYLSDGDLNAMAVYLQDLPHDAHARGDDKKAGDAPAPAPAPAIEQASLDRGRALYLDNCAACHMAGGNGQPHAFPTLRGNPSLQSAKADSVIRIILGGARMADPRTSATGLAMPAYGWKFSDPEVADVANYIRNTWGNRAAAVTSGAVAAVRRDVHKGGADDKDAMNSPY